MTVMMGLAKASAALPRRTYGPLTISQPTVFSEPKGQSLYCPGVRR